MTSNFRVVIPARYESSRLPGKVLREIRGKPMVQHVWERAIDSSASEVVIATDNERVLAAAKKFGADTCMTSEGCRSGTDRVAEVCKLRNWKDTMPVVNVQGDAPLMPTESISRVAALLDEHSSASIATLCTPISSAADYADVHVVKVVFDAEGRALYFSRAPLPARGHDTSLDAAWQSSWRHLGLYAYRMPALHELAQTPPCKMEQLERLEQLRAMWLGMEIRVGIDPHAHGPDVDTEDDLLRVAELLEEGARQ